MRLEEPKVQSNLGSYAKTWEDTMLIHDNQRLTGAKSKYGHSINVYDDGFGPLFISRCSIGINGIVRAQTWEDAYEICEDEFFPEANETIDDFVEEYGENWSEDPCFQEGYGFRPNGVNSTDKLKHSIYAKDLNGDYLDALTSKLLEKLEITLEIETEE